MCLTIIFNSHLTTWNRVALCITCESELFFTYMMSTMIEWLKLTFSRKVNLKQFDDLSCFWQYKQYLISLSSTFLFEAFSWFDRFKTRRNFNVEECSKRQCNWCSFFSIKWHELSSNDSIKYTRRQLSHSMNEWSKRQMMKIILFFVTRMF